jgi:hypothetical protein
MLRPLALLTFILVAAGTTLAAEKPSAEAVGDYWGSLTPSTRQAQTAGRFAWDSRPFMKRPPLHLNADDNICYTMRSVLVEKRADSDVTDVVGQRTCTPSSRFQMKHSVQKTK